MRSLILAALFLPTQDADSRFPPLKVPEGFRATLFAADPLIEYPSVIALGPRPGSVFVPHDYMTGLGTEIVRRDEIRLVEDSDGDGRADRSTLYAGGFNSIQGLAWHDGTVFAMHAPFLTALRDTDGDGKADERRDLLSGLGWVPEKAPDRLHCANGVTVGHDGWLYLALGDRGCDVARPEGDRLVLNGGGILRCRPDGRDLHVFSTGLRNIYDVALDDELNVFVRDNENDGGTYMIRVCHSFFGADHGYPYHYEERKAESMPPLADLGRGSAAGGACYLGTAFPPEYRGDLFFCEWGRSIVRYRRERAGSSFAPMKEIEFASGGDGDPYGFKPTDIVVDRDGSLLVSDWADDQRPRRGRGRIYRITWQGTRAKSPPDDGTSRLRAVWALAREGKTDALHALAAGDPDPRLRAQAVRALGDLLDPVLVQGRLDAPPADGSRLAALGVGQDRRVILEVVVALGRLRWSGTPAWLRENLGTPDPALAHAAQQALRRSGNWPEVLPLLDGPLRDIALHALAEQADSAAVDGLIARLGTSREIADLLVRVHRKPGPWVYWGFRPGPRPPNTVAWERTEAIETALDGALANAEPADLAWILRRMQREKVPARPPTLLARLKTSRDPDAVGAILHSLPAEPHRALEEVVLDRVHAPANRLAAFELLVRANAEDRILPLAGALEDSPVLARVLREIGRRPKLDANVLLAAHLAFSPEVRVAAIEALADRKSRYAASDIHALLGDADPRVRAAASSALGKLEVREAADKLLSLARDPEAAVRKECLEALRRLREPRAVEAALPALKDRETVLEALALLGELGGPGQAGAVETLARGERSSDVLQAAAGALAAFGDLEALGRVQAASGLLLRWTAVGPLDRQAAHAALERLSRPGAPIEGRAVAAAGPDSSLTLSPAGETGEGAVYLAVSDLRFAEPAKVQFLASSNGSLRAWINGRLAYRRDGTGAFRADSDRFDADLEAGPARVVLEVSARRPTQLHARFRLRSAKADHERLMRAALAGGNVERGRDVFQNAQKPGCVKCHRLGPEGPKIGPDLTGIGRRFSRVHLIESILEPSRTILPAFQNRAVKLKDGRILSGVAVSETDTELSLGDAEGKLHAIAKAAIEQQKDLALSLMPEGLERTLTDREFVDLIAYLASLR